MTDWMNRLVDEARRQGYGVRQTLKGTWVFSKGGDTWTVPGTPVTLAGWTLLLDAMRNMGLDMPEPEQE